MSKQTINLGATPNGAGGDTPRSAFTKVQANIDEIYAALGAAGSPAAIPAATPVANGGTGAATPAGARTNLGLKAASIADIIGTVSQSGGIPNGAIMEQGSNSNGQYVKFASGTMICWRPNILSVYQNASNLGYVWTYPVPFIGLLTVWAALSGTLGTVKLFTGPHAYSVIESQATLAIFSSGGFVPSDASQVGIGGVAVGRWF